MAPSAARPRPLDHGDYLGLRYFTALDGVRAVAILTVMTWHVPNGDGLRQLNGYRGVTVFFVLSGFLITTLSLREEDASGSLGLKAFFVRRVFRILPLYYFVLLIYAVLTFIVSNDLGERAAFERALPYYVMFLPELPNLLGFARAPFEVAWSLGVEEKFYVAWPLVGFFAFRGRAAGRLAVLLGACALIGAMNLADGDWIVAQVLYDYFFLLLGCLLAVGLHDARSFARLQALGRPLVGLAAVVATAVLWMSDGIALGLLFGVAATASIAATVLSIGYLADVLGSRPLRFVGRISYPLYLTHVLSLTLVHRFLPTRLPARPLVLLAIAVPVSIGVAWVLHRLVETPMIRAGRRLAGSVPQPG